MEVKRGTSRAVFLGERYVAKVPFPKLRKVEGFVSNVKHCIRRKNWNMLRQTLSLNDDTGYLSLGKVLRGWFENLREAQMSKELGDIVVPTRFSIFGVINIMDRAEVLGEDNVDWDIWQRFYARLEGDYRRDARHTFSNPKHFGWHDGQVKLADYGERCLQDVLCEKQEEIRRGLQEYMDSHQ